MPIGYDAFLQDIKLRIQMGRIRAALAVNKERLLLYWGIGRDLLQREHEQGWHASVTEQLAEDIRRKTPIVKGLSLRDLQDMRSFAEAWPDEAMVQAPLAQIPWGHNIVLLEKLSSPDARLWYAQATTEHGWGHSSLVKNIERRLYECQGKDALPFERTLPWPACDLTRELLEGSHTFEFVTLQQDIQKPDAKQDLTTDFQDFPSE